MQRRKASAAVAAAELPVPEEQVGPTPRSKMRISIWFAHDAHKLDVGVVRENRDACKFRRRGPAQAR